MGCLIMQSSRSIKRQPAYHMLASEFSEATLNEKGSGEYDPSFVITKLGAKVNRVAGMMDTQHCSLSKNIKLECLFSILKYKLSSGNCR